MKKLLHILLITTLIMTLVLGGATTAFGAASADAGGIKVIYDGKYITFKDAAPKIINGRTMVPFRQILEDMGTTVTYDNATKTVTAVKDDLMFFFKIGGSDITISDGASTYVRKMDVVPFLDNKTNRTYVPARFMAETLGFTVGWDDYSKTVIINDYESFFATADEDFSILNYLVESDMDLEKTWHVNGDFAVAYLIAMGTESIGFDMTGDIDSIQHKTDADMTMQMSIDMGEYMSSMSEEDKAMAQAMMDTLKDIDFRIKMNGGDGIMYMNSAIFGMSDPRITENTWIKMDMFKYYDDMGMDLRSLMKMSGEKTSIGKMLAGYAAMVPPTDAESYADVRAGYQFMKTLIGDDAFKKQVSGGAATYTLNIDSAHVASAIAKTALTTGIEMTAGDITEMISALDEAKFDMTLVIKVKNDALDSYTLEGSADVEGSSFAMDISGTTYDTDMTMSIDMDGMVVMEITMRMTAEETSRKVDLTLPAGATVIDYESLLQY